jgi:hypothetical protein
MPIEAFARRVHALKRLVGCCDGMRLCLAAVC